MKLISKTSAAALFVLGLLSAAAPAHAAKYKVRWLLGHPNLDFFESAAARFKADVEKGSNGEIAVEIVTAPDPWRNNGGKVANEIATQVAAGEAEMGHSFTNVLGSVDNRLWVFDCPYLMKGYAHMEGVIEGPVGRELLAGLRKENMVGLAFTYSGGAEGVATTDREIRGPEDLKGRKVAVFGDGVDTAWLSALGAEPVAMRHELTTINPLTDAGKIDSALVTWRRVREAHLQERYKFVNMMNSEFLVSATYANQKWFDALPAKHQKLLRDAATAAARIERARTIELNEATKREALAKGMTPVYLSGPALARFQKALAPVYAAKLNGIVGKELIERVRKTGEAPLPSGLELAGR